MGTAKTRAQNKYISKAYDRVNLILPKGEKEKVSQHAKKCGLSTNGFITQAICEKMDRDEFTKESR